MNAVGLLVGLLLLSYLGSFLVSQRSAGAVGLPSGVEYIALGFALGPRALDLVSARDIDAFEPVAQVALGWLAFSLGIDFGYSPRDRRVRFGRLFGGSLGALLTGCVVGIVAWALVNRFGIGDTRTERVILSGGIAAALSETTRHSVGWVVGSKRARGPVVDLIEDLTRGHELLPLIAIGVLFSLDPQQAMALPVPVRDCSFITAGLALTLGGGAALLMRSDMPEEDSWVALLGASLLVIGTAARLALSTMTVSFLTGVAAARLSRRGPSLRAMVGPTEHPVLLPVLVLAGARLDFRLPAYFPWLAAGVVLARLVAKIIFGFGLAATSTIARKAGRSVGLCFTSAGFLSVCIGLAFALRFPGPVGDCVLDVAVISAVAAEFFGPAGIRRALLSAGEIQDKTSLPARGVVA